MAEGMKGGRMSVEINGQRVLLSREGIENARLKRDQRKKEQADNKRRDGSSERQ
jgi:hypothetical protein